MGLLAACSPSPSAAPRAAGPPSPAAKPAPAPDPTVLVSKESFASADPYRLVYSNVTVVNALGDKYFHLSEQAPDALRSYYVDYYLAQMNNGNFSQFVYNSRWDSTVVRYVRQGLTAMGAAQQRKLFEQGAALVDSLGPGGLAAYLAGNYANPDNSMRLRFNSLGNEFYQLKKKEDLVKLNSQWLRHLPNLKVLPLPALQAEVARRAAALPDRAAREAAARANEPRYIRLSRALCSAAGQEFKSVNAFDTEKYRGQTVWATHISSNQGHHFWFEQRGRAYLVSDAGKVLADLDTAAALAR